MYCQPVLGAIGLLLASRDLASHGRALVLSSSLPINIAYALLEDKFCVLKPTGQGKWYLSAHQHSSSRGHRAAG